MDGRDVRIINSILQRPGMYVGNNTSEVDLLTFLVAYEAGSRSRCNFLGLLSERIQVLYNIRRPAQGLAWQLKEVGKIKGIDTMLIFQEEGISVLHTFSDIENNGLFVQELRKQIITTLSDYRNSESINRWPNLVNVCRESDQWVGLKLHDNECQSITKLQNIIDAKAELNNATNISIDSVIGHQMKIICDLVKHYSK